MGQYFAFKVHQRVLIVMHLCLIANQCSCIASFARKRAEQGTLRGLSSLFAIDLRLRSIDPIPE